MKTEHGYEVPGMSIDQRRQGQQLVWSHLVHPGWVREHLLNQQGVDVDQTDLKQMQAEHGDFLQDHLTGGEVTTLSIEEDEVIGAIPVLNDIQTLLNLLPHPLIADNDRGRLFLLPYPAQLKPGRPDVWQQARG